jgi:phosphoribosyl 1,2-cyclic phosphodiesterase
MFHEERDEYCLIDAGISIKQMLGFIHEEKIPLSKIKGVIITHSHSDHVKGLKSLLKFCDIPVISHKEVYVNGSSEIFGQEIEWLPLLNFGNDFKPMPCFGFIIEDVMWVTDTGSIDWVDLRTFKPIRILAIESNYDTTLLNKSLLKLSIDKGYIFYGKRVLSGGGHLSNIDASTVYSSVKPEVVIALHLSKQHNTKELVEDYLPDPFVAYEEWV